MSIKIRGRDGKTREENDDYVLKDGEGMTVPPMFMDSRRMVHDGRGNVAGCRPGFLISDDERAAQAVRDAYAQYDADIGERWRKGPGQHSAETKQQAKLQTFGAQRSLASPRDAVADAYATYNADLTTRWGSQRWQDQPSSQTPSAPQRAFDSPQDAVAASYAEYDEVLTNRWRRQW